MYARQLLSALVGSSWNKVMTLPSRLVGRGELDPDDIHLPGVFVKRVFQGRHEKNVIEQRTVRQRAS